ncbi:hypothetical protein [Lactobacillus crispatus]|uniref:Uncharacterized protein n=1 Tax=Lactobacillus crispatus TaxID=47770 RepID=A0AAN5W5L8_9LACO|nr:hypothetical protein [Lactobacillus crispatus]KAA8780367.1 hypothetical protein F1C01_10930 [Lactobacillus crispatus]KAA8794381.1 hypothetical protein F1C00_05500 [Lactobacillus crispatus]KAA8797927.1 hypothetical protein F1C02_05510 [Lactobacillus crispatus]KAA8801029.1 hypothetical protein F1C03_05585 [Lactobacillus crispatus]KAA8801196.1 hypothetical protein F1C04_09945 [Lactobacillus crispatus]
MNVYISLGLTYAFFILICFVLPFKLGNLLHSEWQYESFRDKSTWELFKIVYIKDTLKLLAIGLPVLTILLLWLNLVKLWFGWKLGLTTLMVIIVGAVIMINKKTKQK